MSFLAVFGKGRSARICNSSGTDCQLRARLVWQENQRSTETWHDSSSECSFTTFHAYEYSLAQETSNLHRNVIFKTAVVPQNILSAKEAPEPEQLWQWLDQSCKKGPKDCDVLAIPHNSNWSSGRMWFPPSLLNKTLAEQRALAQLRVSLEPLAEILQAKGDSECRNGIASVLGGTDEPFELLRPNTPGPSDPIQHGLFLGVELIVGQRQLDRPGQKLCRPGRWRAGHGSPLGREFG